MLNKRNRVRSLPAVLSLICAITASGAFGADDLTAQAAQSRGQDPLFLTMTNGPRNFLAVVNTRTRQMDFVPTGGAGGASGNAGGVAVSGKLAAVVNFGSSNVTVFVRRGNGMQPAQLIKTASQPVSVAFGHNHLVVLGLTTTESFPVYGTNVQENSDGVVQLMKADN